VTLARPSIAEILADQRLVALERRVLLMAASGLTREDLARAPETRLDDLALSRYESFVARREAGEPIAYLLGYREFYGRNFHTDPSVLIPRPESELLVELALAECSRRDEQRTRILDIGTGTGCLAITLKLERAQCELIAIDVSREALTVARKNAARLGAEVIWIHSDLSEPYPGKFNVIVSNPPYIAANDVHLGQGDLRFEPALALIGGNKGTELIETLVRCASKALAKDGLLLIEHGHDQASEVRGYLAMAGLAEISTWRDLAGLERVTGARLKTPEPSPVSGPGMD